MAVDFQFYKGGYYRYPQTHLDLCFHAHLFGANRIPKVPTGSVPMLFVDEGIAHVRYLLGLYKTAVLSIAECWKLRIEGTPLEVCEKFTRLVVDGEYNKSTKLSLSGIGLAHLPPQIALFRDLEELDLSENQLVILFPELPQLKGLEVLDVSGNKGVMLPDLSALPNLRVLRANNCGLGAVPQWLDQCPKLERVELKNNNIEISLERPERSFLLEL